MTNQEILQVIDNAQTMSELEAILDEYVANAKKRLEKYIKYLTPTVKQILCIMCEEEKDPTEHLGLKTIQQYCNSCRQKFNDDKVQR